MPLAGPGMGRASRCSAVAAGLLGPGRAPLSSSARACNSVTRVEVRAELNKEFQAWITSPSGGVKYRVYTWKRAPSAPRPPPRADPRPPPRADPRPGEGRGGTQASGTSAKQRPDPATSEVPVQEPPISVDPGKPVKAPLPRVKFVKELSDGPLWVAETPFPMNPLFKPIPPVNDKIKREIFAQYRSDPDTWSPRKLAQDYGLSVVRIEAILRLKALEAKMIAQNGPVQPSLCKSMERLLGIGRFSSLSQYREPEPIRLVSSMRFKPLYAFADEEETLTPHDAAKILMAEPYSRILYRLDKNAEQALDLTRDKLFEGDTLEKEAASAAETPDEPVLVQDKDETQQNRFQYMFTDTSKNRQGPLIMVRDKDGTLRTATKVERIRKKMTFQLTRF